MQVKGVFNFQCWIHQDKRITCCGRKPSPFKTICVILCCSMLKKTLIKSISLQNSMIQTIELISKHMYNREFKFLHPKALKVSPPSKSVRKSDIARRTWLMWNWLVKSDEKESHKNDYKTRKYYFEWSTIVKACMERIKRTMVLLLTFHSGWFCFKFRKHGS